MSLDEKRKILFEGTILFERTKGKVMNLKDLFDEIAFQDRQSIQELKEKLLMKFGKGRRGDETEKIINDEFGKGLI